MTVRAGLATIPVALLATPAASAQVVASIQVAVAPERYAATENRDGSAPGPHVTLGGIRRLFLELGARVLRPGGTLAVGVRDRDLAGVDRLGANGAFGLRVVAATGFRKAA